MGGELERDHRVRANDAVLAGDVGGVEPRGDKECANYINDAIQFVRFLGPAPTRGSYGTRRIDLRR
jgi:hypothetical protein